MLVGNADAASAEANAEAPQFPGGNEAIHRCHRHFQPNRRFLHAHLAPLLLISPCLGLPRRSLFVRRSRDAFPDVRTVLGGGRPDSPCSRSLSSFRIPLAGSYCFSRLHPVHPTRYDTILYHILSETTTLVVDVMAKKKRTDDRTPTDTSTAGGRIKFLLDAKWRGQQREMARAVGVAQPSLSRVVNGVQEPGRRLLAKIAAHPEIGDTWLYTGQGSPFVAPGQLQPSAGPTLPVSSTILPGPAEACLHMLTGAHFPVSTFHFRVSRYWLKVAEGDPITRDDAWRVLAGDLLLAESDSRYWLDDLNTLVDMPCARRRQREGHAEFVLGVVERATDGGRLRFKEFGRVAVEQPVRRVPGPRIRPISWPEDEQRQAPAVDTTPADKPSPPRDADDVDVKDLVAVFILLHRIWGRKLV